MNWLAKMMYGRYGIDQLGTFALVILLILNIVFTLTGWEVVYLVGLLLAV